MELRYEINYYDQKTHTYVATILWAKDKREAAALLLSDKSRIEILNIKLTDNEYY